MLAFALMSMAALQVAGGCTQVLVYIARKRSQLLQARAIKHCLFVGQNHDQSTGHGVSCFQALPLKQYQVAVAVIALLCLSAASIRCRCQAL